MIPIDTNTFLISRWVSRIASLILLILYVQREYIIFNFVVTVVGHYYVKTKDKLLVIDIYTSYVAFKKDLNSTRSSDEEAKAIIRFLAVTRAQGCSWD